MNEERQINLIVWSISAVSVLFGYCFYRLVRLNWWTWYGMLLGMWKRGNRSRVVRRFLSWVRAHQRILQIAGCGSGIALAIVCLVLPVFGAREFFEAFKLPYSHDRHLALLGPQLLGPLFLLALGVPLFVLTLSRKRIPWVLGVFGLIGAYFTAWKAGEVAHDFGHAVFDRCGGFYGTVVSWLCAVIGAAYILVCIADPTRGASVWRRQVHPEPPKQPSHHDRPSAPSRILQDDQINNPQSDLHLR